MSTTRIGLIWPPTARQTRCNTSYMNLEREIICPNTSQREFLFRQGTTYLELSAWRHQKKAEQSSHSKSSSTSGPSWTVTFWTTISTEPNEQSTLSVNLSSSLQYIYLMSIGTMKQETRNWHLPNHQVRWRLPSQQHQYQQWQCSVEAGQPSQKTSQHWHSKLIRLLQVCPHP